MNLKKNLDLRLLGVFGSAIIILSEFLPWFSGRPLFNIYFISITVALEDSFLYLFPLMSGMISLVSSLLLFYKLELRVTSAILKFTGIGFLFLFFIDLIPNELSYLLYADIGFFLCVIGFIIMICDVIFVLKLKEN